AAMPTERQAGRGALPATMPAAQSTPAPSPAAAPPLAAQQVAPFATSPALPAVDGGQACPRCGRVNKPAARFCALCGAPLAASAVARLLITSPRGSWEQKLDRTPLRIGRRDPRQHHYPELDLAEHDRGIASRNHAVINRSGDAYTITDVGSTNGTLLNGRLVPQHQPQRLRPGDRIKIGEVEMEFRWS
ncbi:MAG TPA: FHA domain-containing protein, partial [Roseiflexaceae bacterium]|nr:FHA domain-containing protein [Roseiflexaceae bacterium]